MSDLCGYILLRHTVMVDLSESMWIVTLQPLKTVYIHYHNAYGKAIWLAVMGTHGYSCMIF